MNMEPLAKTDAIDARMLALYGEAINPAATPVPAKTLAELRELVLARQAAKAGETALKNQHGAAASPALKRLLKAQLDAQARLIEGLKAAIAALPSKDAGLKRRYEILASIKGVGPIVAVTLVACLSELGVLSGGQIALLAGVAPINCDRRDAWAAPHQRRPRACEKRALHGGRLRYPLQPRSQGLQRPPARRRKSPQGCSDRRYAKARPARQYPDPRRSLLDA